MPGDPRNHDLLRPQSSEVYRRRRLVALVLLLVVVAIVVGLIWWIASIFRPTAPEETPAPAAGSSQAAPPQSSASPTPGEGPSSSDGATSGGNASATEGASEGPSDSESSSAEAAGGTCPPEDLMVSAATDQQEYSEGQEPVLELRVDNQGPEPCEANLGTTQQVFTLYSGSDRIFSTEDCAVDSQDALVEIYPDEQERSRFTWPRVRSVPGCEGVSPAPGSGTYRLEVSLGELEAEPVSFTLQ
jgi:hypothetical protein